MHQYHTLSLSLLLSLLAPSTFAQWDSANLAAQASAQPTSYSDPDAAAETAPSNIFTVPTASTIEDLLPTFPPRDPCGPTIQPNPNLAGNTCNVSILNSPLSSNIYGVQCKYNYWTLNESIDFGACATQTVPAICAKLTDPTVQKRKWIWANATTAGVCWMGFWLPSGEGAAPVISDVESCENNIFLPMVGYCNPVGSLGEYNVGGVNLRKLPDVLQTGVQVNSGYPSYVLATKELTASG